MMKLPSIFISYNPESSFEETLAIRLHTIGAIHGYQMLLPDRYNSTLSIETQARIRLSDYFILFSTQRLSKEVQEEIAFAFKYYKDKSKVIVIFDKYKGKNLTNVEQCTKIYIDSKNHSAQDILDQILTQLKSNSKAVQKKSSNSSNNDALAGILLAGLGLFVLGSMLEDK